jgi:pilus assembly protein CpaB
MQIVKKGCWLMNRGIIIVVVGFVVLLLAAAGGVFFLFQQGGGGIGPIGEQPRPTATEEPSVPVLAAAIDIEANSIITDTETALTELSIRESQYNPNDYVTNPLDVQGKQVVRQINANSVIRPSDLIVPGLSQQIPPADEEDEPDPKAYPLEVDALAGVADQIVPGDSVDIVTTYAVEQYIQVTEDRIETRIYHTTKTVVQRAEVLRIVRPARPQAEGEEEAPPPGSDVEQNTSGSGRQQQEEGGGPTTITQGTWIVVLALTDQEAEVLEYTQNVESDTTLVLRSSDDDEIEDTLGVTLSILFGEFDVPVPGPGGVLFDNQ